MDELLPPATLINNTSEQAISIESQGWIWGPLVSSSAAAETGCLALSLPSGPADKALRSANRWSPLSLKAASVSGEREAPEGPHPSSGSERTVSRGPEQFQDASRVSRPSPSCITCSPPLHGLGAERGVLCPPPRREGRQGEGLRKSECP